MCCTLVQASSRSSTAGCGCRKAAPSPTLPTRREPTRTSDVVWGKGKGVIGKCWENRRLEHVLWAPIAHRYAGVDITEAVWVSIPATDAVKEPLTEEQAADRYFETLK